MKPKIVKLEAWFGCNSWIILSNILFFLGTHFIQHIFFQALMGQLSSMKEIVDEKKKDNDAKESLLDKEKRGMEEKLSVQQQKISGKERRR